MRLFNPFKKTIKNYSELQTNVIQSGRDIRRYDTDDYDNGYSSIRAIADQFIQIKPFAVDDKGVKLEKTPQALLALAHPNQEMSNLDLLDTLATRSMIYNKVYMLVWERRGKEAIPATLNVKEERITGFTFLNCTERVIDGKLEYTVWENNEYKVYYPYQVMTFYDTNPASIFSGYSPTKAAKRWTRIEDYITDYQAGFFENGAVPSGQFVITAPTTKEYNDIVDNLENKHRGAGKNNNVVYTFQPIDPNTGKTAQATITWIPFNTNNKDLALKDIIDVISNKTDSVYRVSAMQRAVTDAPNFATAQVDDRNFVEKTVRPFTLKKYSRIQHELNRITGGLGYGITFNLPVPNIAEEEKFKAETNSINVMAINNLVIQGYTLNSVIDALQLEDNWKKLEVGTSKETTVTTEEDTIEEDDKITPEQPANDHIRNLRNDCSCGHDHVVNISDEQIHYVNQMEIPVKAQMERQIERAVDELDTQNAVEDWTEADQKIFLDEMMVIVETILLSGGIAQWEAGKLLITEAGLQAPTIGYQLAEESIKSYRDYLETVFKSYSDETAISIRATLEKSATEALSKAEIKASLRKLPDLEAWRIKRLANTEVSRSGSLSSVESMKEIAKETGYTVEKTMQSSTGNPCPFCQEFIGPWIPVDQIMIKQGETITAADGSMFVNNWDNNEGHDVHANGFCNSIYRVKQ